MRRHGFRIMGTTFLFLAMTAIAPAQPKDKPPEWPDISPQNARLEQTIRDLDGPGFGIVANKIGDSVIAACENGSLQVWKKDVLLNIRNGSGSVSLFRGHTGPVVAVAWRGGPLLATSGVDRKVLIWSFADGKVKHTIATDFLVRDLAFAPDGKTLIGGGENINLQVWDTESGKLKSQLEKHEDWITAVAVSSDGKWIASGGFDGSIHMWDANNMRHIRELKTNPKPKENDPRPLPIESLEFSPKNDLLAAGSGDSKIYFFDPNNGNLSRTLTGHASAVTDIEFHPTGNVMASASKDRKIRLWNPSNGGTFKELEGHEAWVEGVTFVTRGTRLASVGADRTVRVWNLTQP